MCFSLKLNGVHLGASLCFAISFAATKSLLSYTVFLNVTSVEAPILPFQKLTHINKYKKYA